MSKYQLFQDMKKCIACHACEVACKANKSLPQGPMPCKLVEVGPELINGVPRASYVFVPCFHCEDPWCVAACPTGAMQKRESDGVVFIDSSLCVGCKTCISACPWGAPQWNQETRKVVKCDYCKERTDQGLQPACVTVCPTGSLKFSEQENPADVLRIRHAKAVANLDEEAA